MARSFVFLLFLLALGLALAQGRLCVLADLTGTGAQDGDLFRKGAELALKEVGLPYAILDSQSSPQGAVTAASRALNQERCTALVGPSRSTTMRAVIPLLKEANRAVAFTQATSVLLTQEGRGYVFRLAASDAVSSKAFAQVAEELGAKRLAIIYSNDAFGRGLYELFRGETRSEIVVAEAYTSGSRDYTAQLLKARGAELLVIFGTFSEDAAALARQYRDLGLRVPVLANKVFITSVTQQLAGSQLDGFYVIADFYEGANPQAIRFGRNFRMAYGLAPDPNSSGGYDGVKVYAEALRRAGKPDLEEVRKALLGLKNYPITAGLLSFREDGEGIFEVSLLRFQGATARFVKQVRVR